MNNVGSGWVSLIATFNYGQAVDLSGRISPVTLQHASEWVLKFRDAA